MPLNSPCFSEESCGHLAGLAHVQELGGMVGVVLILPESEGTPGLG